MLELLYPINSLFFYRLIFMATLLIAEGMFCYKFKRKDKFVIKLIIAILACFLFALAFPIPTGNAFYSMAMFLIMFAFTFVMALWLFKENWRMILFSLICAYTAEHAAYELYMMLHCFIVANDSALGGLYDYDKLRLFANSVDLTLWIASFINVYWIIFLLFARRIVKGESFHEETRYSLVIIGIFYILINVVINSVVSYYSSIHFERIYIGLVSMINFICCAFGIMFIFEVYYRNNLNRKYEIIQAIRKGEKEQYQLSKQTIDMINVKCHDFRHQIRDMGRYNHIDENVIKNINSYIDIYDSVIKTSNKTLNIILGEKSLICNKYNIKFSCVADGQLISFMEEEDIYSLFGNIIDNAIDAVKELEEDKRIIILKIKAIGNLVSISSKNSFSGEIKMVNGLPKTSKGDSAYHGFGLQSVKMICAKYDGSMEIDAENNIFRINLLFTI